MLNEDKIKLMTSISMLEKKEGKYLFPVRQYFRSDYIEKNLLKALIGYTFCWILGGTLVLLYRAEDLFSILDFEQIKGGALWAAAAYILGLVLYLIIAYVVYAGRYEHGVRGMKVYVSKLKRLDKRYEFQNRTKEMGQEVTDHDRAFGVKGKIKTVLQQIQHICDTGGEVSAWMSDLCLDQR